MNCPRCKAELTEMDRDGITIDRCEGCRGIWLDRGELEKLLARRDDQDVGRSNDNRRQQRQRDDDDDDDDDDRRGRRGGGGRSFWDIFD
jgi:Zn-finger nucleic acid-binding protein